MGAPVGVAGRLRGGEDLDKALARGARGVIRLGHVAVERGGVVLSEDVNLVDAAVEAVAHGHVDEAVGAADGHRGLGALGGEGAEAGARAAAEDDRADGSALARLEVALLLVG